MENRLKVLNICSWFPNEFKPTLGNFVQKHAESISQYNDVITLSIFSDSSSEKHRIKLDKKENLTEIQVYYPKKNKGWSFWLKITNFLSHRKAFLEGFKLVKKEFGHPDIVHLNIVYPLGIWAYWLKKRYGTPYVVTENSSGFHVKSDHAYPKPIMNLCKLILRNSNYLLPVSENLKTNLKILSPKSQFAIISNVVDENLFLPKKTERREYKQLIHISTGVDEIKNLSGMIRVMSDLKSQNCPVYLDIVSDGDINYAQNLANQLDLSETVFFHSTKSTQEIAQLIQEHDALLMFSNYENFPCVIAEAMMCGKPVISSNVNGIPEHVHDFNGILVNPRDEENLGIQIKRFVQDEVQFDSVKIRDYAMSHFSYTEVGKKFNEIYRKVLNID